MTTKNQLALRMGEEVDILELFFEALERPQPTIVTEMLSNGFDADPPNVVK